MCPLRPSCANHRTLFGLYVSICLSVFVSLFVCLVYIYHLSTVCLPSISLFPVWLSIFSSAICKLSPVCLSVICCLSTLCRLFVCCRLMFVCCLSFLCYLLSVSLLSICCISVCFYMSSVCLPVLSALCFPVLCLLHVCLLSAC